MKRKLKRMLNRAVINLRQRQLCNLGPTHIFPTGSANWLIHREMIYGGIQHAERIKTSPHDPRDSTELATGHMRGGDRMLFHGYAGDYSRWLRQFNHNDRLIVAEFGILRGNGLALWCDLFPNARVIGFDIDIGHFERNQENLINMGAFSRNRPEVHEYDQFIENQDFLRDILGGGYN